LDFDYKDWARYRETDPIWCHSASRFKFTKLLELETRVFNRAHFTLSVDPMRLITVPNTLNGETGLICSLIGRRKDLEKLTISNILDKSKPLKSFTGYPEPFSQAMIKLAKNTAKVAM
jgi:hypothetical protein